MNDAQSSDRQHIYDLKIRYGIAVDTCDKDLMRSCFTDNATWRYDPIGSQGPLMRGWDEFSVFWDQMQEQLACTHQFTNFTFDIDGDDAGYSCLLLAQHWARNADFTSPVSLFTVGGRYQSRARRTDRGWCIYEHRQTTLWQYGNASAIWPHPA